MIIFKKTKFGNIGLEEKGGSITKLVFENDSRKIEGETCLFNEKTASSVLKEAFRQLDEYFDGKRTEFDLPLAPQGTPFMKKFGTRFVIFLTVRRRPIKTLQSLSAVRRLIGRSAWRTTEIRSESLSLVIA